MTIFDTENLEPNMIVAVIPSQTERANVTAISVFIHCKHCGNIYQICISSSEINTPGIWEKKAWDVCAACLARVPKANPYTYTNVLASHPYLNHG